MFGKNARIILMAVVGMVFFTLAFAQPSHAALEQYTWKDYKTITASGGVYGVMVQSGGDRQTIEFVQSPDNPSQYIAEAPTTSCPGKLILTMRGDTAANLTTEGDCTPSQSADKNIQMIGSKDVAKTSVDNEDKEIRTSHDDKNCSSVEQKDQADCLKAADTRQKQEAQKCLSSHNYQQDVTKGDAYLDCMAKALDVERPGQASDEKATDEEQPDCNIADSGWIVCHIVLFVSSITDHTFSLLKPFLAIDSLKEEVAPNDDSTTYSAWKQMRTIANIILVIAFMIIIYSQLSGWGIDAYGIKKLLPRLIIASFLINTSFFLCAIAVDVSNVTGSSLQGILKDLSKDPASSSDEFKSWDSVSKDVIATEATQDPDKDKDKNKETDPNNPNQPTTPPADEAKKEEDEDKDVNRAITQITVGGATIGGIAVLFLELSALVPIMVTALFAMITVLLVLLLREAVVIVLVVLAPLAFACYLLPNTNKWFDRWKSTFLDMLILYPAISLIFGASFFASQVVRKTAEANGEVLLTIFSLGIQVIPLFVAPLLIKVGGGVVSQFAGIVNNKNKGVYDRSMNYAKGFREDRKNIRQMNAANGKMLFGKISVPEKLNRHRGPNRRARRAAGMSQAGRLADDLTRQYTGENAEGIIGDATKGINPEVATKIQEALLGRALNDVEKLELEEVDAVEARYRNQQNNNTLSNEDIINMAQSGMTGDKHLSEAERRAAIRLAGEQFKDRGGDGNIDGVEKASKLIAQSANMSVNERRELIGSLRSNGVSAAAPQFGGSALGKIERGEVSGQEGIGKLVASAANGGKFSQNALADASSSTLNQLHDQMAAGNLKDEAAAQLRKDAAGVLTSPNLNTRVKAADKQILERMR